MTTLSFKAKALRYLLDEDRLRAYLQAIWDEVLVPTCAASNHPDERASFVLAYLDPEHPATEFRFQGRLGFGGKFWLDDRLVGRVTCYREDETPENLAMIRQALAQLASLRSRFVAEPA